MAFTLPPNTIYAIYVISFSFWVQYLVWGGDWNSKRLIKNISLQPCKLLINFDAFSSA